MSCPFCDYQGPSPIIYENNEIYVIEPLDPVTPGHLLVIPFEHVFDAVERPYKTGRVFAEAANHARFRMKDSQFNFITSIGSHATQTVGHLHVHIVPRRFNDGLMLPWSKP